MSAECIDGVRIRGKILSWIEQSLAGEARHQGPPGLAVIRVGDDPASVAYIRQKRRAAESLGYAYREWVFESSITENELIRRIERLNRDPEVHGVLVQLPLPRHLSPERLVAAIAPDKDVDGLHPVNAGRLFQGLSGPRPCTPLGVMYLLEDIGFDLVGKRAVIVGRSNIVGKPMALMLLAANATATLCHRYSELPDTLRQADLVVAAVGSPGCIRGEWIKQGAVVIDVGINRIGGRLVGDVDFDAAAERASHITPVPGGVGAITVAMLMRNTYEAWKLQTARPSEPAGPSHRSRPRTPHPPVHAPHGRTSNVAWFEGRNDFIPPTNKNKGGQS